MEDIKVIDQVICKNIKRITLDDRGFLSQNILPQLRNFIESIAVAILKQKGQKLSSRTYKDIQEGLKNIQSQGRYKDLQKFHDLLRESTSHYTVDSESSERLMLKYYEYLLKLKKFVKKELNLEILNNIGDFPLDHDPQLSEYYEKIANKLDRVFNKGQYNKYYIHKIKPFFINQMIYYEVSFVIATNNTSKFERIIAFTKLDIMPNYAVNLSLHRTKIDVLGRQMEIFIISHWDISIRQCEIKNFSKIFQINIEGNTKEEHSLMTWLKNERIDLVELINSHDSYYQYIRNDVVKRDTSTQFFSVLDRCRQLIKNNQSGKNIVQYLLYRMNNKIIKAQYNKKGTCDQLSGLSLHFGCIPFEQMPFATSPIDHNPRFSDLFDCLDIDNREHELFARKINQNNEIERILFSDLKDLDQFKNIPKLMAIFNKSLYQKKEAQRL